MRWIVLGVALVLLMAAGGILILHGQRAARPPGAAVAPSPPAATGSAQPTPPCVRTPADCGFPDASDTGVPSGTSLQKVPGQVTSGPGWSWVDADHAVEVTRNGTTITGLAISGTLDITASRVTVNKVRVTSRGGSFGISLRHTAGVTIENSTVTGGNTAAGRVGAAISDLYGDSTGMVIKDDNIAGFKTAIEVTTGLITGNYIHDPGYVSGDHTNGILDLGTAQPLTVSHNTILISLGQTDAVSLDAARGGQTVANKTIENNLLGGGSYTIYGGSSHGNTTRNITISGNVFSQAFYPSSGQFGAAAYFAAQSGGNRWAGNTWDGSGQAIGFGDGVAARCEAPMCQPGASPSGGQPSPGQPSPGQPSPGQPRVGADGTQEASRAA
jgi:hypothetical protein